MRAIDALGERLRILSSALWERVEGLDDLVAVCVEGAAIPYRCGRIMAKPSVVSALGRVRGLVDAFAVVRGLAVVEETPQELKALVTGRRDASKAEVQAALELRFPEVRSMWPKQKGLQEHAADALAAAVAGLESDLIRAALRAASTAVARATQGGSR